MTCASNNGENINDLCFTGDGIVKLQNGNKTKIEDLKIRDCVESKNIWSQIREVYKPSTIQIKNTNYVL